jgi:hypothetical protein
VSGFDFNLLERVLNVASEEYRDRSSGFRDLDAKAQSSITTAGIFLAAALAFLRLEFLEQYYRIGGWYFITLLSLSIFLLVGSVVFSLVALRIRKVAMALESGALADMVDDLLSLNPSERDEAAQSNFLRDQLRAWRTILQDVATVNESKARTVFIAQILLTLAIVLLGTLLLALIIASVIAP